MRSSPARELPGLHDVAAGGCVPAAVPGQDVLRDPNTGGVLREQRLSAPDRVEAAVAAAVAAVAGPDGYAVPEVRLQLLEALAGRLEDGELLDALAVQDSLATGLPLATLRAFLASLAATARAAAAHLRAADLDRALPGRGAGPGHPVRLRRLPWGPAVVVPPWNMPALSALKTTAYALAAGAPVLVVPSLWAPAGPQTLVAALAPVVAAQGLPPGVLQLVHGGIPTALVLAADPRVRALAFTGGRRAGTAIARVAAGDLKTLQLELGSANPAIVRDDADVDAAADALARGATVLNGQWCESPGAVFAPRRRVAALAEALGARFAEVRLGDALDPATTMGPQANLPQQRRLLDRLGTWRSAGADVRAGGPVPAGEGFFVAPTVVLGLDTAAVREETFGPVLTLHPVDSDAEALSRASGLEGGLAGYVFGSDPHAARRVAERVPAGEVKVNTTSVLDMSPESTQGFWGGSGVGGHGDARLLDTFLGARVIGSDAPGLPV